MQLFAPSYPMTRTHWSRITHDERFFHEITSRKIKLKETETSKAEGKDLKLNTCWDDTCQKTAHTRRREGRILEVMRKDGKQLLGT